MTVYRVKDPQGMKGVSKAVAALAALALWSGMPGEAFAATDDFYANSASWSVNTVADSNVTNSFAAGANGHTTLNTDVYGIDTISVSAGWKIKDNSAGPGTDTSYPRTVAFSAVTNSKPSGAPDVSVAAITSCTVTSAASTCMTAINFTAPTTVGSYQIQINTNGGSGPGPLSTRWLQINFTVAEDLPEPTDTKLTVYPQCYLLNQGSVDITARLEELESGDPIEGAEIDFYIDPPSDSIGSEWTDAGGVATLVHDITGLSVGDHNLYAEFAGDIYYNASNDSDTLGITYLFLGFGQPINGDGTSIFGGRVIPVKIRLFDANGAPVADAGPTIWLQAMDANGNYGTEMETTSVSAADTGNIMRYDAYEEQYIYNWDARDLSNGTYKVVVHLGDSPTCRPENPSAIITVQKKTGKK